MTRTRLALLPILVAVVAGACISSATPPATPAISSQSPVTAPPSESAAASSEAPSAEPTIEPSDAPIPTAEPTPTETPAAASASPSGSGAAAGVDGCTGNDGNREFFANAATRYSWPVYCAVLPARWNVLTGSFGSGKLDITYKGPSGAGFELHEGAVCPAGTDCTPSGPDAGTVSFGDKTATLIHVDDGSLAAVVDRGASTSWLAIGHSVDETTFSSFVAALIRLD